MSENHITNPIEPETVGKIAYWKRQLHILAEPGVFLIILVVAVFSWNFSGWHKEGVIEAKKAELDLLKTQLDASVADANKAIQQMKELGLGLAAPIADELAVSGWMFQYIHLKNKLERVQNIAANLKKLGASQKEIDDVCGTIYSRVTEDHIRNIIASLGDPNPDKKNLLKNILEKKFDEWDEPIINELPRGKPRGI